MTDRTSCLKRRPAGFGSGKSLPALAAALTTALRAALGRRLGSWLSGWLSGHSRGTPLRICGKGKSHEGYPSGRHSPENSQVSFHGSSLMHLDAGR